MKTQRVAIPLADAVGRHPVGPVTVRVTRCRPVPPDRLLLEFAYVPPRALSLWQFDGRTAREFGLPQVRLRSGTVTTLEGPATGRSRAGAFLVATEGRVRGAGDLDPPASLIWDLGWWQQ